MAAKPRAHSLIGVDVGRKSIEMAQLARAGEGWRLLYAARAGVPVAPDDESYGRECARVIRRLLSAGAFKGKQAAAALSMSDLDVRPLRLPAAHRQELRQMVRFEIEAYLPYPIDDAVVDYVTTGEVTDRGERKTEVIAVSAMRQAVDRHLAIFDEAGLRVEAIDMIPCALARALGQPGGHAVAVVDIGFLCSAIVILRGQELIFCRRLDVGSHHITQALAERLGMEPDHAEGVKTRHGLDPRPLSEFADGQSEEIPRAVFAAARDTLEQMAEEIEKSLRYCSANRRGMTAQKLLLAGGGALMKNVDRFLSERLNLPVEPANPFAGVEMSSYAAPADAVEHPAEFAAAVGLAKLELRADAVR